MDDVKQRIEELALTAISETYGLKVGTQERQRAVQDVVQLTDCLDKIRATESKIEMDETRTRIEQDKNDIEELKNRDEIRLKEMELEQSKKESRKKIIEITIKGLAVVGIPLLMLVDEHTDGLLPRKVLGWVTKPKF